MSQKLCECGCGEITNLAPYTNKTLGYIKGKPTRFICGHSLKVYRPNNWGELNVNWKGDNALPNQGNKRAIKRFKINNCGLCGNIAIDRHHRDGNTLNNDSKNVQPLCRRCHMKIDGRLDKLHKERSKKNVTMLQV